MSAFELIERCRHHLVAVSLEGDDRLRAVSLFPESHPLPAALVVELRQHKPEVISATHLPAGSRRVLLASTGRLGTFGPTGAH